VNKVELETLKNKYKDINEILELANKNDADAQCLLGHSYGLGEYGLEKDETKCREWLIKSAKNGNKHAIEIVEDLEENEHALMIKIEEMRIWLKVLDYEKFKAKFIEISKSGKFVCDFNIKIISAQPECRGRFIGKVIVNSNSGIKVEMEKDCPLKVELKNFSLEKDRFDFVITKKWL
jgi:TPR repeat protein